MECTCCHHGLTRMSLARCRVVLRAVLRTGPISKSTTMQEYLDLTASYIFAKAVVLLTRKLRGSWLGTATLICLCRHVRKTGTRLRCGKNGTRICNGKKTQSAFNAPCSAVSAMHLSIFLFLRCHRWFGHVMHPSAQ